MNWTIGCLRLRHACHLKGCCQEVNAGLATAFDKHALGASAAQQPIARDGARFHSRHRASDAAAVNGSSDGNGNWNWTAWLGGVSVRSCQPCRGFHSSATPQSGLLLHGAPMLTSRFMFSPSWTSRHAPLVTSWSGCLHSPCRYLPTWNQLIRGARKPKVKKNSRRALQVSRCPIVALHLWF